MSQEFPYNKCKSFIEKKIVILEALRMASVEQRTNMLEVLAGAYIKMTDIPADEVMLIEQIMTDDKGNSQIQWWFEKKPKKEEEKEDAA